jgi:hypothetical protein
VENKLIEDAEAESEHLDIPEPVAPPEPIAPTNPIAHTEPVASQPIALQPVAQATWANRPPVGLLDRISVCRPDERRPDERRPDVDFREGTYPASYKRSNWYARNYTPRDENAPWCTAAQNSGGRGARGGSRGDIRDGVRGGMRGGMRGSMRGGARGQGERFVRRGQNSPAWNSRPPEPPAVRILQRGAARACEDPPNEDGWHTVGRRSRKMSAEADPCARQGE